VRGDDVLFSVSNRFELATMNGIACFGEEFGHKHGPMTAYLDARYHLLHALLDERRGARALLRIARRQFLRPLLAYHYSSARAVTLALRHLAEGPSFFRDNLDLADVRAEIASWTPAERMLPLDRAAFDTRGPRRRPESKLRVLVRALTLQGFLLPQALLKNRVLLQEKAFHGSPASVFRYRRVLYEHFPSNTGYVAEYDRGRFFVEVGHFIAAFGAFVRRLPELRREHRRGFDEMTTLDFWRAVYSGVLKPKPVPASTHDGVADGDRLETAPPPRPTVSA
jgi:galactofuranosylgalactofuranosylrhamnosyl-N-acetylglucosaminyl-diphospho-decaprenol beta-1,5/1,6-galactofuranosyltransferase